MRRLAPILLVLAAAMGCVTPAPRKMAVTSKRAASAPPAPKRIFVVSHVLNTGTHPNFGPMFEQVLKTRLTTQFRRCGAETVGISMGGLDLEDELEKAVAEFKPDAVLTMQRVRVFLYDGAISQEIYEFKLLGPPRKGSDDPASWWVAKAEHLPRAAWEPRGRMLGYEEFVDGVVSQMRTDGFFPECALAAEPSSWGAPIPAAAYAASTELRAHGSLAIGALGYEFARAKVKLQVSEDARRRASGLSDSGGAQQEDWSDERLRGRTPATGGVAKFTPDLGSYFRTAAVAELAKMGIATTDPRRVLGGEIEEATVDFSGWGVGAALRVRWELTEAGTGKVLYSGVKTTTTPERKRPLSEQEAFDLVLRLNAEGLAKDPQFAAAIQ